MTANFRDITPSDDFTNTIRPDVKCLAVYIADDVGTPIQMTNTFDPAKAPELVNTHLGGTLFMHRVAIAPTSTGSVSIVYYY